MLAVESDQVIYTTGDQYHESPQRLDDIDNVYLQTVNLVKCEVNHHFMILWHELVTACILCL
jgi:lysine/ornithine N-monooxygenase